MQKLKFTSHWACKTAVLTYSLLTCIGLSSSLVHAQERLPAVEMTSILNAGLDTSGALTMTHFNMAFVPKAGVTVDVLIKTTDGKVVHSFKTRPEYKGSKEAFTRHMVDGVMYAKHGSGDYLIDFLIKGELVTRFPFRVVPQGDDGDPFTTSRKFQFIGPWQKLAYLHFTNARNFSGNADYKAVNLRIWGSKDDLSEGSSGGNLLAKLMRDGKLIGHSKRPVGYLSSNKPINRVDMVIFQPHDKQGEANVLGVSEASLVSSNYTYRLTVERQKDGTIIRDFTFQSKAGKLVPLPRTELAHTPHHEYLAPRAAIFGTQNFEFESVHWLEMN